MTALPNTFRNFLIPTLPYVTSYHTTSGLPDYGIFEAAVAGHPEKVYTNADVIPILKSQNQSLAFTPGEKWQYCNLNFCLLALLVEKISGLSFAAYIERKNFKTCGDVGYLFLYR